MSLYRWKINRDHITEGEAKGVQGPGDADLTIQENPSRFALYDDDGNCYYQGVIYGDYSGFEPLDDFGMPNAGCTSIKIDGEWL